MWQCLVGNEIPSHRHVPQNVVHTIAFVKFLFFLPPIVLCLFSLNDGSTRLEEDVKVEYGLTTLT